MKHWLGVMGEGVLTHFAGGQGGPMLAAKAEGVGVGSGSPTSDIPGTHER